MQGHFEGGYGLLFDGRWNTVGLEKLLHIEDPTLLPALMMARYDVPDDLAVETFALNDLPADWRQQEGRTQQRGDRWHESLSTPLLRVSATAGICKRMLQPS